MQQLFGIHSMPIGTVTVDPSLADWGRSPRRLHLAGEKTARAWVEETTGSSAPDDWPVGAVIITVHVEFEDTLTRKVVVRGGPGVTRTEPPETKFSCRTEGIFRAEHGFWHVVADPRPIEPRPIEPGME